MKARYFVGVDLGQRQDFTAIAVVEKVDEDLGRDWVTYSQRTSRRYDLRHLERLPLGTGYVEVVARIGKVVGSAALAGRCALALDATGVGGPVVDMLRAARLGCELTAVVITGGERQSSGYGFTRVPKRDLITGLQVLLERGELRVAAGLPMGRELINELLEMRVKISDAGHDQYGVWREGKHDDLVLAVALGCWRAGRGSVGERNVRLI